MNASQPGNSHHANLEIWLTNRIASNYSFRKAFDFASHSLNHMKWKSHILNVFKALQMTGLKLFTKKGNIMKQILWESLWLIFASASICISNNDPGKMQSLFMTFADDKNLGGLIGWFIVLHEYRVFYRDRHGNTG